MNSLVKLGPPELTLVTPRAAPDYTSEFRAAPDYTSELTSEIGNGTPSRLPFAVLFTGPRRRPDGRHPVVLVSHLQIFRYTYGFVRELYTPPRPKNKKGGFVGPMHHRGRNPQKFSKTVVLAQFRHNHMFPYGFQTPPYIKTYIHAYICIYMCMYMGQNKLRAR